MPTVDIEGIGKVSVEPAEGQTLAEAVDEIVAMQPQSNRFSVGDAGREFARGANRAVAGIAGAPVDLMNAALGRGERFLRGGSAPEFGEPVFPVDRPFGGSESIRSLMDSAGMTTRRSENPDLAPFGVAGEVIGGGTLVAGAPLVGAARGAVAADNVLAPVINAARQNPGQFAAAETVSNVGAGIGGAGAAALAPDSPGARMVGEMAGGLSPTAMLLRSTNGIGSEIKRNLEALTTEAGRERAAGAELRRVLENQGEDPNAIAALAGQANPAGLPTAALTESPTLTALERTLIQSGDNASRNAINEQYRAARESLNADLARLEQSGNPEALRVAAQARSERYGALLDARIALAEQRAQRATEGVLPDSPDSPAAANVRVRQELDAARSEARQMENSLWERIPQDVEIAPRNTLEAAQEARGGLLVDDGETLPAPVESFLNRAQRLAEAGGNGAPITSGELLTLRSRAQELARQYGGGATPNLDMARRLRIVADGATEDLAGLPQAAEARAFSAEFNRRFGPVRSITGSQRSGLPSTAPELTLRSTLGQGGDAAAVAARQQREAVVPIGDMPPTQRAETIGREQEQYIRGLLRDAVDPNTGRVSAARLARFRERNRQLLEQFPNLRAATETAEQAERFAASTVRALRDRERQMQQTAFARVAGVEDPSVAFSRAMTSDNPSRDVAQLLNLARRTGEVDGARSSFVSALVDQAVDRSGNLNGERFLELLNRHSARAVSSGVLSTEQLFLLNRIGRDAERLYAARTSPLRAEEEIANPSGTIDLLASIAGANAGSMSALGRASGAQLVVAQRGAAAARRLLGRTPQARITNVVTEALRDPQEMRALLVSPQNARQRRAATRQLNAFLIQMGIPTGEDDAENP